MFQIRVRDGLIEYPTGKSAMIHYDHADDVRDRVLAFADRHPDRPWLCRHSEELTEAEAARIPAICDRLVTEFRRRFGAAPSMPQ